ncbi:hypothetical protein Tco_0885150 [Tanacetum coccineum]
MTESPLVDLCFAVPVFSLGDDQIDLSQQVSGETMQVDRLLMLNATTVQCKDEEQLKFLADPGVPNGQAVQTIIPNNATFQTEDLDTYDSDCDDISNAKAVLMANISNYGSDVISEVPHSKTYLNDMENQSVHAMHDFEQTSVVDVTYNEITSDSNIIPDSLIDKLNLKSAKNEDLKAQIQDKVFVITSLKNDLRKVKGKETVDIAAQIPSANTIVPGMFKLDIDPLAPRYMPNAIKLNAKKVAVKPKNNVKKVRLAEPLTSSSNIKQVMDIQEKDKN